MNQVESNAHSLLRLFLPQAWLEPGTLLALILFLLATAWIFKTWWQGGLSDLHSLAWVGLVTNLFDPRAISYEQITLVVPFFLWAALARSRPAALLWLTAIVLSWGLFSVAATGAYPLATEQGPVLLYGLWLAWFFRQRQAGLLSHPQPAVF